jgi:hypothetical protein
VSTSGSRALTPRAQAGDTEEVDCQRAETHLQLLAEEELRRPPWAGGEHRIREVAQLLVAIGALDDEVADRIVADFSWPWSRLELPDATGRFGCGRQSVARQTAGCRR